MALSVRMTTLKRICGEPDRAEDYKGDPNEADKEHRIVTIYDYGYGVVGWHIVDVSSRLVFPKPIPQKYWDKKIIGCWS